MGLKNCLDLNPDFVDKVQEQVETLLWSVPDKIGEVEADAKKHVEQTVSNLKQVIIEKKTEILTKRRKRLSENLISDCEYEIANKKQKLERLQKDSVKLRKQYVYRKFRVWKCNVLSQTGKKKGSYLIDRGAETAIFNVFAENSKAHRRCHGEEGIQTREMLRIANQYLKRNKRRPIKSKETVRAFGKPRNKRSLQAKQHRGKSLWSFTKSQKKECNRSLQQSLYKKLYKIGFFQQV